MNGRMRVQKFKTLDSWWTQCEHCPGSWEYGTLPWVGDWARAHVKKHRKLILVDVERCMNDE